MKSNIARIGLLFTALILSGCSRSLTQPPTPTATFFMLPPNPATAAASSTPAVIDGTQAARSAAETPVVGPILGESLYAVTLLPAGEKLNVRAAAGTENAVIATLPAAAKNIVRTGAVSQVGDTLWVEIALPAAETGWVSARYLTEYVPPEVFCADNRIQLLLSDFSSALQQRNGDQFAALISPAHGLDLRYYRYGAVANYNAAEAAWAFQSAYVVNWGDEPGSGFAKEGSFSQVPAPALTTVFSGNYTLYCNDAQQVAAFAAQPWPEEYAPINYYLVYLPGENPDYGGLDWQAWAVGVEYVNNEPYLFALIHFEWTP